MGDKWVGWVGKHAEWEGRWEENEGRARNELVMGQEENEEEMGEGKEGEHSWVIQHGRSAWGSGGEWMDRGWDGWMEGEGGVTGLPSSNRDRWRPSANRVSPSFHLRPHGKIPLLHICGQTRGPGMLVQHYSKMTDVGGGWWREGWRRKEAGQGISNTG